MTSKNYRVALVGYGYWGKNIARVFSESSDFDLEYICDQNTKNLEKAKKLYPSTRMIPTIDEISPDVDVVAIITPADTHFPLAKKFLTEGKHVLVTKPFTKNYAEAQELVALAKKMNRTIFVDHTFFFNAAVRRLKEHLHRIGTPYFVVAQRMNLGLYQPDVNVIYDLMPHDLSILAYLFDDGIKRCTAEAFKVANLPQEDLASTSFEMTNGIKGTISVSWLAPSKIRQFIIVGSKGMVSYDDGSWSEKLKFYDTSLDVSELTNTSNSAMYTQRISYRSGDMYSPAVPNQEALTLEMKEFAEAIRNPQKAEYYNQLNLRVMESLDRILTSCANASK
jgi:predicted dehydrogenase